MKESSLKLEMWIAWRHLRKKRGERFISLITWLSTAGVALGVASLIVVFSVMTGYAELLRDKIIGLNAHITVFPERRNLDMEKAARNAMSVEGVRSVSPFVMGQAMIASRSGSTGIMVRGLMPGDAGMNEALGKMLIGGRLSSLGENRAQIIVGRELANELKTETGDTLRVTVPAGGSPRTAQFKVAGIFSSGMYEFDSKIALVSIEDARLLLGMGESVSGLEIRVGDIRTTDAMLPRLYSALGPDFTVVDWKKMNHNMFYALELQRVVLSVIMGLVVLVAAFNVCATLIMLVLEKTREIGILKAMGAKNGAIGRIFAIEGLTIGIAGAGSGTIVGLVLCGLQSTYGVIAIPSDVYLFSVLPVSVSPAVSALFALSAVLLCYLATAYPSWRASRLNPVEAIRIE